MTPPIRVRFAPSPTGFLHIGGIRTALFNYLFAKKENGTFLLRIEDTDHERSTQEFEDEIINSLRWLNLNWDEPLMKQSSRLNRYQQVLDELLREGRAYQIEEAGRSAVKLKVTKEPVKFNDLVHGPIQFDTNFIEDFVIQKSDGYPTYHFACVIDDHDMNISHVIRGDDHVSNTPKQILIYQACKWKVPEFAHLPLVFGQDKTPLSKRHGAVSLVTYRKDGYLPEALLNYLALLGWSPGSNQEVFGLGELIQEFSLKKINKTNACFDPEKLKWINAEHIRKLSHDDYLNRLSEFLAGNPIMNHPRFKELALLYQERIRTFQDFLDQVPYLLTDKLHFDPEAIEKYLNQEETRFYLEQLKKNLDQEIDFSKPQELESLLRKIAEKLGVKAGALIHPTRVALTGRSVSPGLFELMSILGKEITVKRLDYVIINFKNLKV